MNTSDLTLSPAEAQSIAGPLKELQDRMGEVVRGKAGVIDQVIVSLLAGGHVLVEDLPGLGKTTLAYALARAIDGEFRRIQFTSDLLPSDILGVSVFDDRTRDFVFRPGPIFSQIVLADEINRCTPKTQSALLEAMDRGRVSADGQTYELSNPFMVIATQNPVDFEGTFPLPDSQMDRFLLRVEMGYPAVQDELEILTRGWVHYDEWQPEPVVRAEQVVEWQMAARRVFVERSILEYMLAFIQATRTESEFRYGLSTRGALSLKRALQARALLCGRAHVLPEDLTVMASPVCLHRLALRRPTADLREERHQIQSILQRLLDRL